MRPGKALTKLAQILYRTPEETSRISSRGIVVRNMMVLALVSAAALGLILPAIGAIATQWAGVHYAVRLDESSWTAGFGRGESMSRTDPGIRTRVRKQGAADFWLRSVIPIEKLRKAHAEHANILYLGTIRGTFSLWIDGTYYFTNSNRVYQQIAIPIPFDRLAEERALSVAIRITNDIMHGHPDLLGESAGEGFMTPDDAATLVLAKDYEARIPAILLAAAHLILATIFFGLWVVSPKRAEYFYVALYSTVSAFLSLLLVDTLIVALNPLGSSRTYMVLMIFKAACALLLALSFARVRSALSLAVLAVAVVLAAGIYFYQFGNPLEVILFSYGRIQWVIPASALLGALICLQQALFLASSDRTRVWHELRVKRLMLFSLSFAAIFLVSCVAIWIEPVTAKWNIPYRVSDLILIYAIGAIVFSEYRDRERQLEAAPGSEYHKRPVLPESVGGAILTVDLKNSEPFYRSRASAASDVHPVVQWRTHMNAEILRAGGCVVRNKGDEISVLFDEKKTGQPVLTALNAALEILNASARLENAFRLQGLLPPGVSGLNCRIAVTAGELRPIFERQGASLEPQWEEAGSSTPLLASARLLEMEKSISGQDESSVVLFEALATMHEASFAPLRAPGALRNCRCDDKHGAHHELALVRFTREERSLAVAA